LLGSEDTSRRETASVVSTEQLQGNTSRRMLLSFYEYAMKKERNRKTESSNSSNQNQTAPDLLKNNVV
jgi:hypothetical protein